MNGEAGGLVRVFPALSSDGVFLVGKTLLRQDAAVLKNDGGIAEKKINGPTDLALAVKLAHGVRIQRVLVASNSASKKY